jgi:hypothetical protein
MFVLKIQKKILLMVAPTNKKVKKKVDHTLKLTEPLADTVTLYSDESIVQG